MNNIELWLPVVGYEGFYEVSNLGNVRRVGKTTPLVLCTNNKHHYATVSLCKENKKKTHLVHVLVAKAFLGLPKDGYEVNHKNENKLDNRANNLEWVTRKENSNYGTRNQRISEKLKVVKCKPVAQIKDGVIINIFPSTIAARDIADPGHIGHCCHGKYKSAGGFQWKFV